MDPLLPLAAYQIQPMSTETPTPAPTKKPRALPRVWRRYATLSYNDGFFIGRNRYVVTGFFHAESSSTGKTIRIWPWTRVQTEVLVRDARSGGKSSVVDELNAAEARVDYVECACKAFPGRVIHGNSGPTPQEAGLGNVFPAEGGHGDAPVNNDNKITGPTA